MLYFFITAQPAIGHLTATHCVGRLTISSPRLCFAVCGAYSKALHVPSYSPCRLLCPECVLLCRRNGAGIECKNKERQCEPIQSHCLSSRLFFSWRILGKYPIMYLHIEWQRALNGSAFFALALILLAGLISAFSLYSINWYPNFNYPTNYLQVFCAISIIQTTN